MAFPTASDGIATPPSSGPLDRDAIRDWLGAFADTSRDHAILLLDPALRVLWANPTAHTVLNLDGDTLAGCSIHRFFTEHDQRLGIPEYEAEVALKLGSSEDDRWMRRADGSLFWATGRTEALTAADGRAIGTIKIFRDQTDVWMYVTGLHQRIVAVQRDERQLIESMAVLSHELRNPLAVIGNYVMLIDRLVELPELAGPLTAMRDAVGAMRRMIEDLDNASRLHAGKVALDIEEVVLDDLLAGAIDAAFERASRPERTIVRLLPHGAPIVLQGDRVRLHQAIVNLVGNALKFTHDGGHVSVAGSIEASNAVVRVKDDGIGIEPQLLETIFDMFTQAPGTTATQKRGLGIGLGVVKQFVELHGGSVQANSRGPGLGAEFVVRLPLAQAIAGAAPAT